MKRCNACEQDFASTFVYCPADATLLTELNPFDFRLTLINSRGLLERLLDETLFLFRELRMLLPELRRDPVAFVSRALSVTHVAFTRILRTPHLATAITTALMVVLSTFLVLLLVDKRSQQEVFAHRDSVELVGMLEFPTAEDQQDKTGHGVGANSDGRVGFRNKGSGEGSGPTPKKSTGGGGGGEGSKDPAQIGKLPPPSEIPAPIPKFPPANKTTLPAAGIDIDPALWQAMPMAVYGDPRSKSTVPSNGPGTDGGMGNGNGTGVGVGSGPGVGPGQDGNIGGGRKGPGCCGPSGSDGNSIDDPDRVYPPAQTSERARVLAKPEPQYTEEARRNAVSGSVVLRVVFSRTGEVTNIRAVQTLPFGLTERAIAAARQIRFRPATKNGRSVNVFMQLEYNFNLY